MRFRRRSSRLKIVRLARHHEPPCQLRAPVNRRFWRFRSGIRGHQREPRGFILRPSDAPFETETPGGQLPAKCLGYGADLKPLLSTWAAVRLDLQDGGSPAWIRTTIHGSKGRCPTIRRPGNRPAECYRPVYRSRWAACNAFGTIALEAILGRCRVRASNPLCGTCAAGRFDSDWLPPLRL